MAVQSSEWMPLYEVVAHVEQRKNCYRERAIGLVRDAMDKLEVRSRTIEGPPRLVSSYLGGSEIFREALGQIIELWRDDVLRLWPISDDDKQGSSAPVSTSRTKHRPITDGVMLAIEERWGGRIPAGLTLKEAGTLINEWLKANGRSTSKNIDKALDRVLKKHPDLHEHPK